MIFFQNTNQNDTPNQVDFNPGLAVEKLDAWLDGFIALLPNMGVAMLVVLFFYLVARIVKKAVQASAKRSNRPNLGQMLGGLVKYAIIIAGAALAMTIVIPSINPGDLIAGLGVSSVAIGFAFKDILQNWLAGLLILIRQPFEIGDQIVVGDFEGTVERIETRATIIKTYSGERIVIPNNEIYTNSVKVNTAHNIRRSQYDVGIGYGDDIQTAISVLQEKLKDIDGIDKSKGIEILPWDLAASWVTLRIRWWTSSEQAKVIKARVKVIEIIKNTLDDAKIDMPYDTKVHLFHDQTEETDGDRNAQREGWPSDEKDQPTTPKWKAQMKMSSEKSTS